MNIIVLSLVLLVACSNLAPSEIICLA
mgnify:CR=1